jgi:excisionase family DNA binding protein
MAKIESLKSQIMGLVVMEDKQFQEIRDDFKAIKNALECQGKMSVLKKWGTASEVENLLGIKRRTVYHYVAKGILKAHKVGGFLLFDLDEIRSKIQNECGN